ncbi:MAG: PE-PPE domain-containing protein [Mycobacterium sp.]
MKKVWSVAVVAAAATVTLAFPAAAEPDHMFFLEGTFPIPLIPPPVKSQAWMAALFDGAYADDVRVNVEYPASVWPVTFDRPTMGRSVEIGVQRTECLVQQTTSGQITVVGRSQGALVVDQLAGALASEANSLDGRITFIAIADPNRPTGIFTLLPAGTYIPILNLTNDPPPDSPYDTTVLVKQYDGISNFPDRPWNLVSDFNAAMGILYYHAVTNYIFDPLPTSGGTSVTNPLGGVTTTYFIPTPNLPLTQPLRDFGIPADLVNGLDSILRPVVDAGYSQLTPNAGPYISYGRLIHPSKIEPAVTTSALSATPAVAGTVTNVVRGGNPASAQKPASQSRIGTRSPNPRLR